MWVSLVRSEVTSAMATKTRRMTPEEGIRHMTQHRIFETEGRAIPYIEEGSGPIGLVLIASESLERDGLGTVTHYLDEEAGFRVVRVGQSADRTAVADRIADVEAVIDHLGFATTWIGGYGAGGTIAREYANTHTERLNGLLLLSVEDVDIPLAPMIPVLIVQATEDATAPFANGEKLQATAPDRASIKTVEGADHLFPVTHPIETAVIIEEYLDWD